MDGQVEDTNDSNIAQQERTKSSPSCYGSEKSESSINHPPHFKAKSTSSCCGSVQSDSSLDNPPLFKTESFQQKRTKPPLSCFGSEKERKRKKRKLESIQQQQPSTSGRDSSICHPTDMSDESPKNRSNSPSSCCGSVQSDSSLNNPPLFKTERALREPLGSAQSATTNTAPQTEQTDLPHIFTLLEDGAFAFMKKEFETFQRLMSPDYQEDPGEQQTEDTDRNEKAAKDGALKIALHIFRAINREDLANLLEKRLLGELQVCQSKLKSNLKRKSQNLFEGIAKQGNPNSLKKIYTELYIILSGRGEVNNEHEVRQMESVTWKIQEAVIKSKDIFKPGQDKEFIRIVLTIGIAGIGKTVCSQKYILDWAEGIANKTIDLILPFPFRELNLMKDKLYSLLEFIQHFFVDVKEAGIVDFSKYNVVLVFDGLDESRFALDFADNEICCDITQPTTLDALLTNLIQGNLLPSAHIWITSRPAAANQIPPECVDRVTEVRGFKDPQKEEFFRKRLEDQTLANEIVAHVKTTRSLHIMCHIPMFCWMSATVLENILTEARMTESVSKTMVVMKKGKMPSTSAEDKSGNASKNVFEVKIGEVSKTLIKEKNWDMPKTLGQMYIHFLKIQMKLMEQKYPQQDKDQVILLLGKLAYEQLETGKLLFYESDLKACGIDVKTASVYSGMCTQIFREEKGLYQEKMYCFVHLSIQEFMSALYVFLNYVKYHVNLMAGEGRVSLAEDVSASLLYKSAVDKALRSETGHLDLFLRFLVGFSADATQNLLQGLLREPIGKLGVSQETTEYIKEKIRETPSAERCMNLFHCLGELNDHSLVEEIQAFLNSGLSDKNLSSAHWSALVFVLLSSEEELKVFDLKKYSRSEAGLQRLLPVVKASNAALLDACNLTERSCEMLYPALSSNASQLKEMDLSDNGLQESGIKTLCVGLINPHCKLESLRLNRCSISGKCCETLVPVLSLISSKLRVLDLGDNDLLDFGVKVLCGGLAQPQCTLECLRLPFCGITSEGCNALVSAIESNPSYLEELDLSYNHPGESGVRLLSELKDDPMNKLERLRVDHNADCWLKSGLKSFACDLTLDPNTVHKELTLSDDLKKVMKGELQDHPDHPERFESCAMVLCKEGLSGRYYWEVEWSRHAGDLAAYVGVAYKRIPRKGGEFRSLLGRNEHSWSIRCANDNYMAWHNRQNTIIPVPAVYSNRLGLYLDWPAGILSFYSATSNILTHLHTFQTTFEAPVYAAFRLWADDSTVSLCPVEKPSSD